MKRWAFFLPAVALSSLAASFLGSCTRGKAIESHDAGSWPAIEEDAGIPSVLQHHKNSSRDGFSIDPALTATALTSFHQDLNFTPTVDGAVYAQPLFMENGPQNREAVFVVTENDSAYALDAHDGQVLWQSQLATPAPRTAFGCGNIDPLGITGTPVIDSPSRTLFLDAMTMPNAKGPPRHKIFALSVDDGSVRWRLDVDAAVPGFDSEVQNQRGALALLRDTLYVPYGGFSGDCGNYHGWLVAVPLAAPTATTSFVTGRRGSALWAPSGAASDGTSLFVATGNAFGASNWSDANSEAVLRLDTRPSFSGFTEDYFAPDNWQALDDSDSDLGSAGVVLFDVPQATPGHLAFVVGKPGVGRLLSRDGLGGIADGLAALEGASGSEVLGAMASYTTLTRTYVAFAGTSPGCDGDLTALAVSATSPPTLAFAWCASQNGRGSPMVTSSDGQHDFLVWSVGAEGDQKLHAFDADTGTAVYASSPMANLVRFITPIEAKGRVYVAGSGAVYAFTSQ